MAFKRMQCLERKLLRDSELLQEVNSQIERLLSKGYATKLSQENLLKSYQRTWYLPTFLVRNANKPEKVRLVWDAAAMVQGISLNTLLYKGPDQLVLLVSVLFAFRSRRIALIADISEMYHQIRVREEDKQALRFIWRFGDTSVLPETFHMNVLPFGPSCSGSIAQYVKNCNAKDFESQLPRVCKAIEKHHLVDDLLDSVDNEEEAIKLAKDIMAVHLNGGFYIRNWLSNSKKVLDALGESESLDKQVMETGDLAALSTKVLGLWWKPKEDVFTFSLCYTKAHDSVLKGLRMPTKRELLRLLMSIFDPLGFLAHFLSFLKVLLKEIWQSKIKWDEAIPSNLQHRWERWRKLLGKIEQVEIPRCYSIISAYSNASIQLHVFVDASEHLMAAVAYFRISDESSIECSLIMAKTKVAPQRPQSIPKMELQAALIGARLADKIAKDHELDIQEIVFWTDSSTVLSWLLTDDVRKFKPFVMFRVTEILKLTKVKQWRWVPTKQNVADDATKWSKNPTFEKGSRWFNGPSFLYQSENEWHFEAREIVNNQKEELKLKYCLSHERTRTIREIDFDQYPSWIFLQRMLAWVIEFIRIKMKQEVPDYPKGGLISQDLKRSRNILIRMAQSAAFSKEITILTEGNPVPKTSELFKLSPYLDEEGIIRLKGRIDAAWYAAEGMKRPIIMPKSHRITFLIVEYYHRRFHHRCQETVVNELRQAFWIPKLRAVIRSVRKECQRCKNNEASPRCPEMASLPEARLAAFVRPFTFVGLDYFGPILITVGRSVQKRWGVLFTCLTIRAIHVEVANDLSADCCIMCIRNFMARRGVPREVYSDNGTNLRGAERELREAFHKMNKGMIQDKFTTDETQWFFNPPAAPHMGGSWERLVGSVKTVLKEITRNQRLRDETLRNMLIEVESIINSRPLTHVSLGSGEAEALTPNHFLLGSSNGIKPIGEFNDSDLILRRNWRISQQLSNLFWKRWVREYLPTLTRRTKWYREVKNIEEGDVVIIVDGDLPKGLWPKGIVVKTIKAKDGVVRRAKVRTANGIYERPVVKLAVLDVSKTKEGETSTNVVESPGGEMLLTE